jgi:hypothetical protein
MNFEFCGQMFEKSVSIQFHQSFQWESSCSMRTGRRRDGHHGCRGSHWSPLCVGCLTIHSVSVVG